MQWTRKTLWDVWLIRVGTTRDVRIVNLALHSDSAPSDGYFTVKDIKGPEGGTAYVFTCWVREDVHDRARMRSVLDLLKECGVECKHKHEQMEFPCVDLEASAYAGQEEGVV